MKKSFLIIPFIALLLLLLPGYVFAQQKKGSDAIVIYHQKVQLRPRVGKVIKDDTLKYSGTKSIFRWHMFHSIQYALARAAKKHPEKAGRIKKAEKNLKGNRFNGQQTNLVDIAKDSIYSQRYLRSLHKWIYYKEKRPVIHWQFKDSTKKIGNYKAKKATAHFRGRNYTAWYTPKIPVPYGPWKLGGLPGLILQAYDSTGNFYFSAQKVNFTNISSVGPIHLNGSVQHISFAKYKDMMNHFNKYLRKMIGKAMRMMRAAAKKGYISQKRMNKVEKKVREIPTVHTLETFPDSKQ